MSATMRFENLTAGERLIVALDVPTLEEAKDRAIVASQQYAKRQRTWFRKRMKDWVKISLS
mgnify:CR=1 FL=1